MKHMIKVVALLLVLVSVFSLVSCSSYSRVEKNFKNAGYEVVDTSDDSSVKSITAELEKGEIKFTMHLFKKSGAGLLGADVYAAVIEFASDAEFDKAFGEDGSATLKGLITDAQKSDYVNGTCVLIPLSITNLSEQKKIFKGEN